MTNKDKEPDVARSARSSMWEIIKDFLAILCLFATTYALIIIGYAVH